MLSLTTLRKELFRSPLRFLFVSIEWKWLNWSYISTWEGDER